MNTLEDQLRAHFREEASELEIGDPLPAVLAKVQHARRQRRAGSAVAAAVVVALALGAIPIWRSVTRPSADNDATILPFTVLTRTNLAGLGPPNLVAAVPGGAWLGAWNLGKIFRVDARTGRVTARIGVGGPYAGPYAMAYGAGSLWVTGFRDSNLIRLDPATGHLLARIHVPTRIRDVAVAGGYVWVTAWGPGPGSGRHATYGGRYRNRLFKVSPVTDRIVASRWLPAKDGPGGMAVAGSRMAIWLYNDGSARVFAVNPANLRLIGSARTGTAQNAPALAAGGPSAWVLIDGTVLRIDRPPSAASRSVGLYPLPVIGQLNLGPQAISAGPGRTLWAAGPGLYRIDQATMRFTRVRGFAAVDNVSAVGQTLWVETDDDFLYQLALNRPSALPPVPNVVGMPAAAARQLLIKDGFTVRVFGRPGRETRGRVFFQDPAAGTLIPARATVTIFMGWLGGPTP
jgi:hypothetical protein